jgi:hypothetical protein
MTLIIVSLVIGIAIGFFSILPTKGLQQLDRITTVALFLMLLALGAKIGSNREILTNLGVLGGQAFVIAMFCIAGSIGALWLADRLWDVTGAKEGER